MNVMLTVLYLSLGVQSLSQVEESSASAACVQDLIQRMITLDDLEQVVYSIAKEKGVAPTVILNRLLRKIRTKQRMEKLKNRSPLQEIALQELVNTMVQLPPAEPNDKKVKLPYTRDEIPAVFEPRSETSLQSYNRPPPDAVPIFMPVPPFRPPPGVTIRVNTGGAEAPLPDVTVTISPMMTVVEALRQADAKFRSTLGFSSREDVISFSHSPFAGCYVVSRFDSVRSTSNSAWILAVSDRSGRVIYEGMCLPTRNEVPVKPGTTIILRYTVF